MKNRKRQQSFIEKYGPWAVVAGASEGLGAEFAVQLASRGLNLILVARRKDKLESVAAEIAKKFNVQICQVVADLADSVSADVIFQTTEERNVGLLIYNAAFSKVGPFVERSADDLNSTVNVNVRAPLLLVHRLLPRLIEQKGGIILMSSLAGNQGTPGVAAYGASKAFNSALGQTLWYELRPFGVDVTVCCAGAIRTPGYLKAAAVNGVVKEAPGTADAQLVAQTALRALGKKPFVIPGMVNKFADWFLRKLLTRKQAVRVMGAATQELSAANSSNMSFPG